MTAKFTTNAYAAPAYTAPVEAPAIPAAVLLKIAHRTLKRYLEEDTTALQNAHISVLNWLVKHGYIEETYGFMGQKKYQATPKAEQAMTVLEPRF